MPASPSAPAHRRRVAAHPTSASALARDVIVLGLIWGSSVVFQRFAVAEVEPVPLVTLRIVAAVAFFVPFLPRVRRGLGGSPRRLLDLGVVGAVNPALCGVLSGLALQLASSGLVAVLISLSPLLTALLAKLLLDERPLGRARLAGLGLAFVGVALLIATRSTGLGEGPGGDLRGYGFALAIAFAMAVAAVYTRRQLSGVDPLAAAAGQCTASLLVMAPTTLLLDQGVAPASLSAAVWVSIVASGTLGLGASFVLYVGMIERHGPTAALLALYVMPVAAAILGALFLGETITAPMAGGGALVLAGVFLFTRVGSRR